jgi:phosphocarrier protein
MELLLLGAACGESITVSASGEEAEVAIQALVDLVKSKFGEAE